MERSEERYFGRHTADAILANMAYPTCRPTKSEQNALEIVPPLPQAPDPYRDWRLDSTDSSVTVGANVTWQLAEDFELAADYSLWIPRATRSSGPTGPRT